MLASNSGRRKISMTLIVWYSHVRMEAKRMAMEALDVSTKNDGL